MLGTDLGITRVPFGGVKADCSEISARKILRTKYARDAITFYTVKTSAILPIFAFKCTLCNDISRMPRVVIAHVTTCRDKGTLEQRERTRREMSRRMAFVLRFYVDFLPRYGRLKFSIVH